MACFYCINLWIVLWNGIAWLLNILHIYFMNCVAWYWIVINEIQWKDKNEWNNKRLSSSTDWSTLVFLLQIDTTYPEGKVMLSYYFAPYMSTVPEYRTVRRTLLHGTVRYWIFEYPYPTFFYASNQNINGIDIKENK